MAKQYESIKIISDRLLRNNVMQGLSFESVIDYTLDFLDIVGIPSMFINNYYEAKIENYRVKLPCDFVEEKQILIGTGCNTYPSREATDTFHEHYSNMKVKAVGNTHSINNNYIFTSIEKGLLQMSYLAIKVDEDGYPMIPSNRPFLNALEWFIKYKYYTILWEEGRLEDKKLENAKQEYAWAVGQCETDFHRLTLSRAESFFNSFRTLIPRDSEFNNRFMNNGHKEYIKNH